MKMRRVRFTDLPALKELFPQWSETLIYEKLKRTFESDAKERYVIELAGKVVAHVLVKRISKNRVKLLSLAVHEKFRNKGIASFLIANVISRLPKNTIVFVDVKEQNKASLAVFNKNGFKIVDKRKNLIILERKT